MTEVRVTTAGYREPQYNQILDVGFHASGFAWGPISNQVWHDDPKRIGFLLARYKFVAKMPHGQARVLEIGCEDALGSRIVSKEVGQLVCSDFDTKFLEEVHPRKEPWGFETFLWDPFKTPIEQNGFNTAYVLNVLEHIAHLWRRLFLAISSVHR